MKKDFCSDAYIMEDFSFALGQKKMEMNDLNDDTLKAWAQSFNNQFPDDTLPEDISYANIVIKHARVKIIYSYGGYDAFSQNGKHFEKSFVLHADNKEYFTARELIVKINNNTLEDLGIVNK